MRDWPSLELRFPPAADADLADRVAAALDAAAVAAIHEHDDGTWIVAFRDPDGRGAALRDLGAAFGPCGVAVAAIDVSDEDWARRSQADLGPVRVGRIVVTPPWSDSPAGGAPDEIRLVIEPSMGFGSGHHATTRMCLQALQSVDVPGARVLDVGTGSGILAIAAAKLGADAVLAVDVDPDALEAARAAAAANGCPASLAFAQADFRDGPLSHADVVLANLTGSMLAASADRLLAAAAPGGALILGGMTTAEALPVIDAFAHEAAVEWRGDEDGWVGLILRVRPASP